MQSCTTSQKGFKKDLLGRISRFSTYFRDFADIFRSVGASREVLHFGKTVLRPSSPKSRLKNNLGAPPQRKGVRCQEVDQRFVL